MGRVTVRRPVLKVRLGDAGPTGARRSDTLVAEEPLEIRVGGRSLAVTMRTPGDDIDLVHGFLTTEGVIRSTEDVSVARYCAGTDDDGLQTYNVIDVQLAPGVAPPDPSVERNFFTSSSCGICGKASIDAVRVLSPYDLSTEDSVLDPVVIAGFPDLLRSSQKVFDRTGGLHAAGLVTVDGQLEVLREDVGRHNAVDKVIGWALREGRLPANGRVLMVSGRASFELTQKALMAGIPVLAAVSAPSSLAVDLAAESGMTLIGFLRGDTMNVYSGAERIRLESPAVAGVTE